MECTARRFRIMSLLAAMALLAACGTAPALAQMGFDRPGGDYAQSRIESRDPADCAMVCERDRRCKAWSFTFPSDPRSSANCWLKNSLPTRVPNSCCVSGVHGAGVVELSRGPVENFVDRYGGDYRSLPADSDTDCRTACTGDKNCRAWTFARAGYAGREARCFLKGEIKPPRRAPGLVSGVVR
jgi:hypothetical protein